MLTIFYNLVACTTYSNHAKNCTVKYTRTFFKFLKAWINIRNNARKYLKRLYMKKIMTKL